jgi:hypothetical protein
MVIQSMDYPSIALVELIQLEGLASGILIEELWVKFDEPFRATIAVEGYDVFGSQL